MRYAVTLVLTLAAVAALIFAMPWKRAQAASDVGRGVPTTLPANLRQATFAAGCFWGVEEYFRHVPGVVSTAVGYSGGHTKNPTYQEVCTDLTGHAESVLVTFDPAKVSYAELLDGFWTCHDPTTVNRQGPDVGTQYRSVIFYHDAEQEKAARASMKEVDDAHVFSSRIVTEIVPAAPFYPAEAYHQQYMEKTGGVCHTGPAVVHTELAKKAAAERERAGEKKDAGAAMPG
jgi:peptide-methionine (S)-S-oxide reductase